MKINQNKSEWLQWRRDSQRTGHCEVSGQIIDPEVTAEADIGVYEDFITLKPSVTNVNFILENDVEKINEDELRRKLGLDKYIDLDGNGNPTISNEDNRLRYGRFTGANAWERLYFESAFDKGMVGDDTRGWLERRVGGCWEKVYDTGQDVHYWRPSLVFSDINNDGRDEIVMTVHYRIMAFDIDTGKKLTELKYHDSRNYGDLHAYGFKKDGSESFLQITYFPAHYELIHHNGNGFEVAWFEDVQNGNITDNHHGLLAP